MPSKPKFVDIRSYARKFTVEALETLAHVMRQPKAPPAARVMAANALLDRGWGKAAQLVAVDGEIRQLVEVKLNVVQPDRPRNIDATCDPIALKYRDNSDDARISDPIVSTSEPGDAK